MQFVQGHGGILASSTARKSRLYKFDAVTCTFAYFIKVESCIINYWVYIYIYWLHLVYLYICDVNSIRQWRHQQNVYRARETRGRCLHVVAFIVVYKSFHVRNKMMYVHLLRAVYVLTTGLFWCLFTELRSSLCYFQQVYAQFHWWNGFKRGCLFMTCFIYLLQNKQYSYWRLLI